MTQPQELLGSAAQGDLQVLENPLWFSLTGPHAHFAQGGPRVLRYPADISPFVGVGSDMDAEVWAEIARLVGPGVLVGLSGPPSRLDSLPEGWKVEFRAEGLQLIATDALETRPEPEALVLGAPDAPEMLDLVRRTEPGPFEARTYELGTYLGIRRDGALVAMAGERFHPPGFTEISAVCTDPAFRGQGLAARLVRAVAHGIRERGETPFLHVSATNVNAIRLYESLGFVLRKRLAFLGIRTPVE